MLAIDSLIPYEALGKEPQNLYINLNSEVPPIMEQGYFSLFFNMSIFQNDVDLFQEYQSSEASILLPSYVEIDKQL